MTNEISHQYCVDASGLLCPEPIMMLHNAVRDAASGEVIKLQSTDPSTRRDVTRFCEFLGHELVADEESSDSSCFWIKKA